jgi:hypothetical protein
MKQPVRDTRVVTQGSILGASHPRLSNHCSRAVHDSNHEAALTTNLQKAQFFAARARTTQNKTRRERFVRAAWRYALAATKELKASFEPLPRPPRRTKKTAQRVGNPTRNPTS